MEAFRQWLRFRLDKAEFSTETCLQADIWPARALLSICSRQASWRWLRLECIVVALFAKALRKSGGEGKGHPLFSSFRLRLLF